MGTPAAAAVGATGGVGDCIHWVKVNLALELYMKEALLNVLHNYDNDPNYPGISDDETTLYKRMVDFKKNYQKQLHGVIKSYQWSILCPKTGKSNSRDWDITLIVIVIQYVSGLAQPANGWDKDPPSADHSKAAFVLFARKSRNDLKHGTLNDISTLNQYNLYWSRIKSILKGLCYSTKGMQKFHDLDSGSLKLYTSKIVEILEDKVKDLEENKIKVNADDLKKLRLFITNAGNTYNIKLDDLDDKLSSLESSFLKRHEKLETEVYEMKKGLANNNLSNGDMVLPEVLNVVCKHIRTDWKHLAAKLLLNTGESDDDLSPEENLKQCFNMINNRILWRKLEEALDDLGRNDIVETVKKSTCLTRGLKRISSDLKSNYRELLKNWQVGKKIGSIISQNEVKSREEIYVELCIGKLSNLECSHGSDLEYLWRQNSNTKITLNELFQEGDKLVTTCGIAGVGKSSLIDMLTLKWANNEILLDVDFLFKFTCRELNNSTYANLTSWKELLLKRYSHILNDKNIDSIISASSKILIVVDGFDEYLYSNDFLTLHPSSSKAGILYDLTNPNAGELPNKRVLVSGRPQSCITLSKAFPQMKLVEITGFSENNINQYIDQYFDGKTEISRAVKALLVESQNLHSMATIPVYLSIFCNVYEDMELENKNSSKQRRPFSEDFNTFTKLSIVSYLAFLREHHDERTTTIKDRKTLSRMCEDPQILKTVKQIAEFSYKSLKSGTLVFAETDFHGMNWNLIERTGMIEKTVTTEHDKGERYQFCHQVFQEFLCSLHIVMSSERKYNSKSYIKLEKCLPTIAGLEGLLLPNSNAPNYIKAFVKNLVRKRHCVFHLRSKTLVDQRAEEFLDNQKSSALGRYNDELFFSMFYEYQGDLSADVKKKFMHVKLKFDLIRYHHTLRNVIHFLKKVPVTALSVSILMQDGVLTRREVEDLSCLISLCESLKIYWTTLPIQGLSTFAERIVVVRKKVVKSYDQCWVVHENDSTKPAYISGERIIKMLVLENCHLDVSYMKELQCCIPYLESLHLGFNTMLDADAISIICKQVVKAHQQGLCQLKELWLNDCNLSTECLEKLCDVIPFIKHIRLSANKNINSNILSIMSSTILKTINPVIKELWIPNCDLDVDDIKAMKECIPLLECFNCNCNVEIDSNAMAIIANVLVDRDSKLKELNLSYCNLDDDSIENLAPCISSLENVLLFGNPKLTVTSMEIISRQILNAISVNKSKVKELWLNDCELNDDCIKALCKCLPFVETVSLRGNTSLTSESIHFISDCITELRDNRKIKHLNLDTCELDNDCMKELARCVPFLETLSISGNQNIGDFEVNPIIEKIIACMNNVGCFKELDIDYCNISDDTVCKLNTCLASLEKLTLTSNPLLTTGSLHKTIKALYNIGLKKTKKYGSITVVFDDELFTLEVRKDIKRYGKYVRL